MPKDPTSEPLMTATEACDYLLLNNKDGTPNLNRLYLLRARYGLPAMKCGGHLRFHQSDLLRWMRSRSSN